MFIVLSFLIATMIVGFFAGSISLKKLDVKMRFPDTIFAGEPTPILVSLHNRKRFFPGFSVVVDVRGKEREHSVAYDDLMAILPHWMARRLGKPPVVRRTLNHFVYASRGETVEAVETHFFPRRGRLLIVDFELSTKFPFGFFRHRRRLPARETELFVFPQPLPYDLSDTDVPLNTGQFVASRRGVGQDLLALRDYQPNDDFRHIDWKATARTRMLTVREFAAEDDKHVTIVLDTSVPYQKDRRLTLRERIDAEQKGKNPVTSKRFETGIGLCAALLTHFADENANIKLIVGDEVGEAATGRQHLYECLKRIAVAEPVFIADNASAEQETVNKRIFDEQDDSHWFVITSNKSGVPAPDLVRSLKFIDF